jgi:hypothetical protein
MTCGTQLRYLEKILGDLEKMTAFTALLSKASDFEKKRLLTQDIHIRPVVPKSAYVALRKKSNKGC